MNEGWMMQDAVCRMKDIGCRMDSIKERYIFYDIICHARWLARPYPRLVINTLGHY